MKVIIIGDVVGKPGRKILSATLKRLKEQHEAEFVIANVENAAEGAGLVPKVGDEILNAGGRCYDFGQSHIRQEGSHPVHREPAAAASSRKLFT